MAHYVVAWKYYQDRTSFSKKLFARSSVVLPRLEAVGALMILRASCLNRDGPDDAVGTVGPAIS